MTRFIPNIPSFTTRSIDEMSTVSYDNYLFLSLTFFSGLFFLCVTMERIFTLREKLNTFYFMMIPINFWTPLNLLYYSLQIYVEKTGNYAPISLISFCQWSGYVILGLSLSSLVACLPNKPSRKFLNRKSIENLSPWLITETVIFGVGALISSITMSHPDLYNISTRIYYGLWAFHLFTIKLFLIHYMYKLNKRNDPRLNGVKIIFVFIIFMGLLPLCIFALCHSVFLSDIDASERASTLMLVLYRTHACTYVVFWGTAFLKETRERKEKEEEKEEVELI